jgi:hypothetical protein
LTISDCRLPIADCRLATYLLLPTFHFSTSLTLSTFHFLGTLHFPLSTCHTGSAQQYHGSLMYGTGGPGASGRGAPATPAWPLAMAAMAPNTWEREAVSDPRTMCMTSA